MTQERTALCSSTITHTRGISPTHNLKLNSRLQRKFKPDFILNQETYNMWAHDELSSQQNALRLDHGHARSTGIYLQAVVIV